MNSSPMPLPFSSRASGWPIDVTQYDRSPELSENERAELEWLMSQKPFQLRPNRKQILHRLLVPLEDVFAVTHLHPHMCRETLRVMAMEMHYRDKTFWAWQDEEWTQIIGSSENDMAEHTEGGNCILPVERFQSSPICSYAIGARIWKCSPTSW